VLSSDSPPQDIPKLKERLVSRFLSGLEVRIDPPTFEMRIAILRRNAEAMAARNGRVLPVPDGIYEYIAREVPGNIRVLEGRITRLLGIASLTQRPVTMDLAREVIGDTASSGASSAPSLQEIIRRVAAFYQIQPAELQSRRWTKIISHARQLAMYLARKHTPHSLKEIGGALGGKNHATVLYAIAKVEGRLLKTPSFQTSIARLEIDL
jgi:chromosomal replication initiator protein